MRKLSLLLILLALLVACASDDASLGIIGGADGPTAILVAQKDNSSTRVLYDAMPDVAGIPTPPGTFVTAWTDMEAEVLVAAFHTDNVTDAQFDDYCTVLTAAGYTHSYTNPDGNTFNYTGTTYDLSLTYVEDSLAVSVTWHRG